MIKQRGSAWWKRHESLLRDLKRSWSWSKQDYRTFLLLGEPRLAFNPAVRKVNFQKGVGQLNQKYLSFDQLFAAWGK